MQQLQASRSFADDWGVEVFTSYGFTFPYPFTAPTYPVVAVLLYAFFVHWLSPDDASPVRPRRKSKSEGLTPLKLFCLAHNALLCGFSWVCFINVFPEVFGAITQNGWRSFACTAMSENELFWSYLFYLSKIYEFVDTAIIIYKGRKPSTLQTYHHMGAVFACWLQVIVKGKSFWVFLCLNSFIHTIMYAYYCATTLGYRFKFKFVITILQMTQFVVGQALGYYQYFNFSDCYRTNDFWVWFINTVYVWPLVALFAHFYRQTYLARKAKRT